ncbi:unnamed protein product [Pieris brassicae]|uniref:Uncharacterized protein n=1 Tax=Pieris brassicae TaxID=7116 RepID=A0A9P0TVH0_PIEBR|nr:unnamed protein product [Pieris brassicae]
MSISTRCARITRIVVATTFVVRCQVAPAASKPRGEQKFYSAIPFIVHCDLQQIVLTESSSHKKMQRSEDQIIICLTRIRA